MTVIRRDSDSLRSRSAGWHSDTRSGQRKPNSSDAQIAARVQTTLTISPVGVEKVFFGPKCRQMPLDLMTGNVSEIEKAGKVAIRVSDKGLGIDLHEQKKIFKKFVRAASADAAGAKGTGLGLTMVEHIVASHGGQVRVDSEPGVGSTFTILLPSVKE
jgi:signal transduction histidine kinase